MTEEATLTDSEWQYLWQKRFDLVLRAMMNRMYQQERQRRLEQREGWVKVASLVLGSAAWASITEHDTLAVAGALVFALSGASLVFGWGTKARDAAKRCAEWVGLEKQIELVGARTFTEADLATWAARANEIESGETGPNQHMLEAAYLRACEALGAPAQPAKAKRRGWRFVIP